MNSFTMAVHPIKVNLAVVKFARSIIIPNKLDSTANNKLIIPHSSLLQEKKKDIIYVQIESDLR